MKRAFKRGAHLEKKRVAGGGCGGERGKPLSVNKEPSET